MNTKSNERTEHILSLNHYSVDSLVMIHSSATHHWQRSELREPQFPGLLLVSRLLLH